MLAKYKIEYEIPFNGHKQTHAHLTNDPVAFEEFLVELLEHRFRIGSVLHDGVELPKIEFDELLRNSARMVAANHLCASLGIDTSEAHRRFGSIA